MFFFCKQKLILDAYNKSGNQLHDLTRQITQNPRAANIEFQVQMHSNVILLPIINSDTKINRPR